jgi:glucose-6-phosphate isomerase
LPKDSVEISAKLGRFEDRVVKTLEELNEEDVLSRIWKLDHTVWSPDPTEITNRLGWLHSPQVMGDNVHQINNLVRSLRDEKYKHAVLLGMGGSSLAPDLFRKTFGVEDGFLDLIILDSTDPQSVQQVEKSVVLERTIFIVATKSGGTVETLSLRILVVNCRSSPININFEKYA